MCSCLLNAPAENSLLGRRSDGLQTCVPLQIDRLTVFLPLTSRKNQRTLVAVRVDAQAGLGLSPDRMTVLRQEKWGVVWICSDCVDTLCSELVSSSGWGSCQSSRAGCPLAAHGSPGQTPCAAHVLTGMVLREQGQLGGCGVRG